MPSWEKRAGVPEAGGNSRTACLLRQTKQCGFVAPAITTPRCCMKRISSIFEKSAILAFVVTGCLKLAGSFHVNAFLDSPNNLFHIVTNRAVLAGAGLWEILVAILLCLHPSLTVRSGAIWFTTWVFALYRCVLLLLGYTGPCHCLGGAMDWLPVRPALLDLIMASVLVYLMVGSYLLWSRQVLATASGTCPLIEER